MPLTDAQKKQLANLAVAKLLEYIDKNTISYPDDFVFVNEEKKKQVEEALRSRPNPREIKEWGEIVALFGSNPVMLRLKLEEYIVRWEAKNPAENHVDEAKQKLQDLDRAEREEKQRREQQDWDNVDQFSTRSLCDYLRKYPRTVHLDEIDDAVWNNGSSTITGINEYLRLFPSGRHVGEANRAVSEYSQWQAIKSNRDLGSIFGYVQEHSDSPFMSEANILLMQLKAEEIDRMKSMATKYSIDDLLYYLSEGIFSENDLIYNGVVTSDSLEILRNFDAVRTGLPDINTEIAKCRKECAEGRTDVYFFGIPATGKSCILMGLIGSPDIDVNTVVAGGPYAAALQQHLDAGFTIGQTPADYVATLQAKIPNGDKNHYLNLVEMAGEDFAFKLAENPEGEVSLGDMGEGVPQLLANNNRKAFFLIVDPTATVVSFNRIQNVTDSEGNTYQTTTRVNINQRTTLKRMVDLFTLPENETIMRKVDSIHIIVTKADMCGNDVERDEKAFDLFMTRYKPLLRPLIELCEQYGINVATNGLPKLYTFSLGRFYVGGIYQYDDTDAGRLINVIRGNVTGEKKQTFMDKFLALVNKPILK